MRQSLLLLIGFAVTTATAQSTNTTTYSFSVKQAISYALNNHSSVKNSILDEQIAKKKIAEIKGQGLPQIKANLDVKDFLDIPTQVVPGDAFNPFGDPNSLEALQMGVQYQASAGIEISQLIFSGDYFVGLKAAKVYAELSNLSTRKTKIETAELISKAYYTTLINEDKLQLLDANIAQIKAAMDGAEGMLHYGFAEQVDYDRLKVTYNNLVTEKDKLKRLLDLGRYLLKYQMGMPVNSKLTLIDNLETIKFETVDSTSSTNFDYDKRVEYSLLQTQLKLAKLDVKRNRLSYVPNAYLYGSFSENAFDNTIDLFDSKQDWYPTSIVGGTISMPIFTGMQRHLKTQQAKMEMQKIDNTKEEVKNAIDLELSSSITNLDNATISLEAQKENIELAKRIASITKMKFDRGVGTNLEVISAQAALQESQTNYYDALYDAIVAKIEYDKAKGNLNY